MISVDQAKELILSRAKKTVKTEIIRLTDCYNRILSHDIISNRDIPDLDNSAMDGYAVMSSDTLTATDKKPVILKILSEIQAGGDYLQSPLTSGNAIRIMTGAHIPPGADAVIPFEDTEETGDKVRVFRPVSECEYIRFAGEDVKNGHTILFAGTRIDSIHIGQIASANLTEVSVFKKPAVSVISSGNEIVPPGSADISGKTINSNAYVIVNEVMKSGGNPEYMGIARDTFDDINNIVEASLGADIIISSGGVSMGMYDFIPEVLKKLGAEIVFHTLAMKPGKPVLFAIIRDKLFFGLPGNPASAYVAFMEFVRPALLKMSGASHYEKPVIKAILDEEISKQAGRKHFIRGTFKLINGHFHVRSAGTQSSGVLSTIASANCLIILAEDTTAAEKNSYVDIQLIHHGEISID